MRRSLRLSKRWFHRGLWIVAVVIAFCPIGLERHVARYEQKVDA